MRAENFKRVESGFTLIELLVTVAVIGILSAIAIPQVAAYRTRAFDARAQSDLHNAITGEETYFSDNEQYQTCSDAGCNDPVLPGFTRSMGIEMDCEARAGGQEFQCGVGHPQGSTVYYYNSGAAAFWHFP